MMVSGDEFARTQNGNNNPYKIDSIAMWNNYDMIATSSPTALPTGGSGAYHDNYGRDANASGLNGLFLFLKFLIALRTAHASLRVDRFGDLSLDTGGDVTFWFKAEDGVTDLRDGDRRIHWRINGRAAGDDDFLLCVNMDGVPASFNLPSPRDGTLWHRVIDTATWAEREANCWPAERAEPMGPYYLVHPFSIAVFQERA
jgi:isoamylase